MALPPQPKLAACLEVLYWATIQGRAIGWSGEAHGLPAEKWSELSALMDAVHNIPHLMQKWESCDEDLLRRTLGDFDARFGHELLAIYDRVAGKAV